MISFQKCDILSDPSEIKQILGRDGFDACFDKGTYDAISLCPKEAKEKRQKYIKNVSDLLNPSSADTKKFLILTSCNWTKEELVEQLKESKNKFRVLCPNADF